MAICFCSSWSERPSNWSIGCERRGEDGGTGEIKDVGDGDGETCDEEDVGLDKEEENGERRDTPKLGKPVFGL